MYKSLQEQNRQTQILLPQAKAQDATHARTTRRKGERRLCLVQRFRFSSNRSQPLGKCPHSITNIRTPSDHAAACLPLYIPLTRNSGGEYAAVPGGKEVLSDVSSFKRLPSYTTPKPPFPS